MFFRIPLYRRQSTVEEKMRRIGFSNEFSCRSFGLSIPNPRLLGEPQGFSPISGRPSILYLIYRIIISSYFLSVLVYDSIYYDGGAKWFIHFTYLSYLLLFLNTMVQAGNAAGHYVYALSYDYGEAIYKSTPWWLKLGWLTQNVTMVTAPIVTIIYWALVYDGEKVTVVNFSIHTANTIYVFLDIWIVAIPVRILHMYQSIIYCALYSVFTMVYWAKGGTNEEGEPFVYHVLDYGDHPLRAMGWVALVMFGMVPVLHMLCWIIAKLRAELYLEYCSCCSVYKTKKEDQDPIEIQVEPQSPSGSDAKLQGPSGSQVESHYAEIE